MIIKRKRILLIVILSILISFNHWFFYSCSDEETIVNPPAPIDTTIVANPNKWLKSDSNPVHSYGVGAVLKDSSGFRMWDMDGRTLTSSDGINWIEQSGPSLEKGPAGSWDDAMAWITCVLYDGSTYRMWYFGNGYSQIGYAISSDGITWTKHPSNPVLKPESGWERIQVWAPIVLFNDSTNTFQMWYSGKTTGSRMAIGYATSTDGFSWTKSVDNPVLEAGRASFESHSVLNPVVQFTGSAYQMWYTGYDGNMNIGYATSSDGINWTKAARINPVLETGGPGSWDMYWVELPRVIYDDHTKIYHMWYHGVRSGWRQAGYAISEPSIIIK